MGRNRQKRAQRREGSDVQKSIISRGDLEETMVFPANEGLSPVTGFVNVSRSSRVTSQTLISKGVR